MRFRHVCKGLLQSRWVLMSLLVLALPTVSEAGYPELQRHWSPVWQDHKTTIGKYAYTGQWLLGYIAWKPVAGTDRPLYMDWHPESKDFVTSTAPQPGAGFIRVDLLGYFSNVNWWEKFNPLYRHWSGDRLDNLTTHQVSPLPGYQLIEHMGWVSPIQEFPEHIPLYLEWNEELTDHRTTPAPYSYSPPMGIMGYISEESFPGSKPLYLYFSPERRDYYTTTISAPQPSETYHQVAILGYVSEHDFPGAGALYEDYSADRDDVITHLDINTPPGYHRHVTSAIGYVWSSPPATSPPTPHATLSTSALDFGNLYVEKTGSAIAFNNEQNTRTFSITNDGTPGTKLTWNITDVPSGVAVSDTSGELWSGESQTITVTLNPQSLSDSTGNIALATNAGGDSQIAVSANVYDIPTISHTSPHTGSNGKVNLAVNLSTPFEVSVGNPLFPEAVIWEYEWHVVKVPDQPIEPKIISKGNTLRLTFNQDVEYLVRVRMEDSNDIFTLPLTIPVRGWERPIVKTEPPNPDTVRTDFSLWDTNTRTYVGVAGKSVALQADAQLNGNEAIAEYVWSDDQGNILVRQSPGHVVPYTWPNQNLNGGVYCKAITNYGVESSSRRFSLKVYPALEVKTSQTAYTGRVNIPVTLEGSTNDYAGAAFDYRWVELEIEGIEFVEG